MLAYATTLNYIIFIGIPTKFRSIHSGTHITTQPIAHQSKFELSCAQLHQRFGCQFVAETVYINIYVL